MGCIYRQGRIWWFKYYWNGKPRYESSRSDKKGVAVSILKEREGAIVGGKPPGTDLRKIKLEELVTDFLADYRINQRHTQRCAGTYTRTLMEYFGNCPVSNITTTHIRAYIEGRLQLGLANATINRELAALKRMFTLGAQSTPPKVAQIPYIPMLKENNTRKGFFEHSEYLALKAAAPEHLRSMIVFAYYTGWREGEILNLTWNRVYLDQKIVRLESGETKNDEARTLYLNDDLLAELQALWTIHGDTQYVFTYNGNDHPMVNFQKSWGASCARAGLEGRLFHDFRRTAVRNMVRAGIPERVAMARSGHKTRSIFDRYCIVSGQDQIEAAEKLQKFIDDQPIGENIIRFRKVS